MKVGGEGVEEGEAVFDGGNFFYGEGLGGLVVAAEIDRDVVGKKQRGALVAGPLGARNGAGIDRREWVGLGVRGNAEGA